MVAVGEMRSVPCTLIYHDDIAFCQHVFPEWTRFHPHHSMLLYRPPPAAQPAASTPLAAVTNARSWSPARKAVLTPAQPSLAGAPPYAQLCSPVLGLWFHVGPAHVCGCGGTFFDRCATMLHVLRSGDGARHTCGVRSPACPADGAESSVLPAGAGAGADDGSAKNNICGLPVHGASTEALPLTSACIVLCLVCSTCAEAAAVSLRLSLYSAVQAPVRN